MPIWEALMKMNHICQTYRTYIEAKRIKDFLNETTIENILTNSGTIDEFMMRNQRTFVVKRGRQALLQSNASGSTLKGNC